MPPLTITKLVIFAVGILVWGYGVFEEQRTMQFVGLGIVVVAAILRFAGPRPSRD